MAMYIIVIIWSVDIKFEIGNIIIEYFEKKYMKITMNSYYVIFINMIQFHQVHA